jgi:hypothetical protein
MKTALKMTLGVLALCAMMLVVQAEEKKSETLKGEIQCAKCSLKQAKACTNVIKVKDGDKELIYWFKDKGGKESYHKEICTSTKKGSVTGVVSKETKDGKDKLFITPDKDGVKFED